MALRHIAHNPGQPVCWQGSYGAAINQYPAMIRLDQVIDDLEKRGLAAAIWSYYCNHRSFANGQRDFIQNLSAGISHAYIFILIPSPAIIPNLRPELL